MSATLSPTAPNFAQRTVSALSYGVLFGGIAAAALACGAVLVHFPPRDAREHAFQRRAAEQLW
jgi:hypothetical protein